MKKIIIANWKMNPRTAEEAKKIFTKISSRLSGARKSDIVICPPFIYLEKFRKMSRKFFFGAQNAFLGGMGAFTGEISTDMLYELGVKFVILGHSERRALGEGHVLINRKIKSALASGLVPILCVGENERDENHKYFDVVKSQILECLAGIQKSSISKIIVAYEPVWAISTTKNRKDASPEDIREMAIFIRKVLSDKFGTDAKKTRVLYGGSVNERDAEDFVRDGEVDGLLVGKASLDPEKFAKIVKMTENVR